MASFNVLFLLCSFFVHRLSSATDTITQNKFLRDGETIVSNGGVYALGFFSPGKSKQRYIGIWYNKVPEQTVVWVANRNNPISSSSSGVATTDERGNLVIFNGNASNPVWSTNVSVSISDDINSSSLFYRLLDSGNLVLGDENRGEFLWQSFDFPTHTHLPGMKLGWNLKTGRNWSLTSWKSGDDPSTGDYIDCMDRAMPPQFSVRKGSQKTWRTGLWNGQIWNGFPVMMASSQISHILVNNADEVSLAYQVHDSSILTRVVLDDLGYVKRFTWIEETKTWNSVWLGPVDSCDDYEKCGVFGSCSPNTRICSCLPGFEPKSQRYWDLKDGSQGCVRKRELLCGKGDDGFLKLEKMKLPDTLNCRLKMSLNIKDCEIECRNNCSCTGYASAYVNGSGCLAWFGDLIDMREYTDAGQDFFLRVDAIELENSVGHSKRSFTKKKLVLLCVLIVMGLLIFASILYYLFMKAKRRGLVHRERLGEVLFNLSAKETDEETNAKFELPTFDLNSIIVATEYFSLANKLGSGGFGSVYKGKLPNGH